MHIQDPIDFETILTEEQDLSQYLSEDDLGKLGAELYRQYKEDEGSRADWLEKTEESMRLAMQVQEYKSFPWPDAANVKYPLISIAAMQFASRAYSSLLPSNQPVKARVIGFDPDGSKLDRAIRVSKHMSYQVIEEMEEWEEEMDRLCMFISIVGCAFKKTYYDPVRLVNKSELILPKDLVINYWTKNIDDSPCVTHLIEYQPNEVVERQNKGLFRDIELPDPTKDIPDSLSESAIDEALGLEQPETDETRPNIFGEMHVWIDLDGDGYKEPYVVTLSLDNKQIYRIIRRFKEKNVEYSDLGDIWSITADSYFTKFPFIPNPDGGFYDIGFGVLLGPTNEAVNTIINLLMDSGTLSNMQSGFLGRGIRLRKGNMKFSPGEWKQVQNTGDDLRKSVIPLPVREPSGVLFNLLDLLIDSGQRLSAVSDMMAGESPGQNQPATTTMAVLEQGLQVYSSIYKRLYRALKREFKKLYILNSEHLPPKVYFQVLDVESKEGSEVEATDYDLESVDVVPAADPNVASEAQKLVKAQGLMELAQMGTVNPQEATRRILEAQEQPGIEQLMDMGEPQPDIEILQFEAEQVHRKAELRQKDEQAEEENMREWAKIYMEAQDKQQKITLDGVKTFLDNVQKDEDRRQAAKQGEKKDAGNPQGGSGGMAQ